MRTIVRGVFYGGAFCAVAALVTWVGDVINQ